MNNRLSITPTQHTGKKLGMSNSEKELDVNNSEKELDIDNPQNWPRRKKCINFALVTVFSFMGYFSSAVYLPAIDHIREYFDTNLTVLNITIALFIFFLGAAPLFFAPLSERIGRKWVYTGGALFYTVFTILCGTSTTLGAFITFRLFQAIFASVGIALGGGSCSDLYAAHERGSAVSIYMLGIVIGPTVAPICGGYIFKYLGWRWIFYIKAIIGGVLTTLYYFFLEETLYRPGLPLAEAGSKSLWERIKFSPFASLGLLLRLEVMFVCVGSSTTFGWVYLLITILPTTLHSIYGYTPETIGIMYLAGGIGNICASITAGLISDRLYRWQTKRNGGVSVAENRLTLIYLGASFVIAGSLIYGWSVYFRLKVLIPLTGYLFFTYGSSMIIISGNTYLIEALPNRSASAVSVSIFLRNTFAMFFSLMAVFIRSRLGDNWTYTVAAITCLFMYIPTLLVQVYGANGEPLDLFNFNLLFHKMFCIGLNSRLGMETNTSAGQWFSRK